MSETAYSSSTEPEAGKLIVGGHYPNAPLPEDHVTVGNKFNHIMIRIRDPVKSLHFYRDLMGMRTVFTINGGPFTNYYLGFPHTAEHRKDLEAFSAETAKNLPFTPGLLELKHIHGAENMPDDYYCNGNTPPSLGFGHLGFTVANVPETVQRLEDAGVKFFKPLGVANRATIPLSDWEAERGVGVGDEDSIHDVYKHILRKIAFVHDPVSQGILYLGPCEHQSPYWPRPNPIPDPIGS